uniref:NlpC/P60 domain-containing protein n=1 Tax=Meiothermus ruber TaxID=277 RepID=A0A7C3HYJ9_MEIRU
MSKVAEIALAAVRRELPGFVTSAGWCVAFAFEAIARAYQTNRWILYSRVLDSVQADLDRSRWATDVELAIDRLDWDVSAADLDPAIASERAALLRIIKPGDLLFSSTKFDEPPRSRRTAPDREGHIGIYVGEVEGVPSVAENTRADRGRWFVRKTALRLTPLFQWDTVTTVGRIPGRWRP